MTIRGPAITCSCEDDPRLVAGIAAIACHVAKCAEWKPESQEQLAEATAEACREVFGATEKSNGKNSVIRVKCEPFPDRIEVSIEFAGEYSPKKSNTGNLKGAGTVQNPGTKKHHLPVDSVKYESGNGHSRLTIIQYGQGEAPANLKH